MRVLFIIGEKALAENMIVPAEAHAVSGNGGGRSKWAPAQCSLLIRRNDGCPSTVPERRVRSLTAPTVQFFLSI